MKWTGEELIFISLIQNLNNEAIENSSSNCPLYPLIHLEYWVFGTIYLSVCMCLHKAFTHCCFLVFSGTVGCLEACLPDISYQRHIARGFPKGRTGFGMAQMLQQWTGSISSETLSSIKKQKLCRKDSLLLSRRSLSLEDLSVVTWQKGFKNY